MYYNEIIQIYKIWALQNWESKKIINASIIKSKFTNMYHIKPKTIYKIKKIIMYYLQLYIFWYFKFVLFNVILINRKRNSFFNKKYGYNYFDNFVWVSHHIIYKKFHCTRELFIFNLFKKIYAPHIKFLQI